MGQNNKLLKVLILVDHAKGTSGPHRNVVGSLNALSVRKDISLTLLTGAIDVNAPYYTNSTIRIQLGFHPKKILRAPLNLFYAFKEVLGCDVVYIPTNLTSWLYALFCGAWGKKFIAGPNVTGVPLLMPVAEPNPIMTTWFVDKWIENSQIRKYYCERAGTDPKHIEIIHHSIDANDFSPIKRDISVWEKYGINNGKLKIIHVGRATEKRKGVPELIEAFKILNKNNEYDLIYVGLLGDYWDDSFLEIPGVHCLGPVYGEDLRVLYASSDLFFGLSTWESFWFTPLEAMASGLPVVVTKTGAVSEMIPHNGVEGFYLDGVITKSGEFTNDVSVRAASMLLELVKDYEKRTEIGKMARKYVEREFSEQELGRKLVKVFKGDKDK